MAAVKLNQEQENLKNLIEEKMALIKRSFETDIDKDPRELIDEMALSAHKLHMSLEPKPKHHRYMIENRGMQPEHPDFYKHIHPVEDLLAYIENDTANDDPEDQTIGQAFTLSVFSRRWGHNDTYGLVRTSTGWDIGFMGSSSTIRCDKKGYPNLYKRLEHDSINYPEDLKGYIEYLWNAAQIKGLSKEEVQKCLDDIGEWISMCEKMTPRGIFRGYN